MNTSDESLTVSELNNFIRDVLNSGFPQAVWVCGEIQELRDKKHLYFTLSEKDPDSHTLVAKMGATIWANVRPRLEAIIHKAENAFTLKDDIEVKLLCKVDFYPPFGQVRLIVEGIDPTYTLGKIAQDRQRLIAQLKQKGIFDKNKQLTLPLVPLHIGLITSYGSAAYYDFVDELKKSGYTFRVRVVDSIMQGKTTENSVARSIKLLNEMEDIDVIVITRGGGSITELSAFDSQLIAESIALSKIPILSGIGHEINTTITDLTAHTFLKTPTATAQFLIERISEFLKNLEEKEEYLFDRIQKIMDHHRQHIKDQAIVLQQSLRGLFQTQTNMLSRVGEIFKRHPAAILKAARKSYDNHSQNLKRTIHLRLTTSKTKILSYQKLIDVADPKNVLKKGFSITRNEKGKVIKTITHLKSAEFMNTQFNDGFVISTIKEIHKE